MMVAVLTEIILTKFEGSPEEPPENVDQRGLEPSQNIANEPEQIFGWGQPNSWFATLRVNWFLQC